VLTGLAASAQQSIGNADVSNGSKADIQRPLSDFRFTPKSGHQSDEIGTAIAREHINRLLYLVRRRHAYGAQLEAK
jgi:hypothetical protein